MRILTVVSAFVLMLALSACTSSPAPDASLAPDAAETLSPQPYAHLAQLMRGIPFPNSNTIFDTQTNDPGVEREPGDPSAGALSAFANIYPGWMVVESAALALAETANLIMIPGRLCENGRPVPVERADWIQFTQGLRDAGMAAYEVAQTRDLEKMAEVTNQVADACAFCHEVYRDTGPAESPARCVPPSEDPATPIPPL